MRDKKEDTSMVNGVNGVDYFKTVELDATYDFNKDGTVDAQDYAVGYLYIQDDDESNDIQFTKEQLDAVFAGILASSDLQIPNTTDNEANSRAATIIKEINSGKYHPNLAQTLNELQTSGKKLSAYIKEAAELSKILEEQIPILQDKLADKQKELDLATTEYDGVAEEVNILTAQIQEDIAKELAKTEIEQMARKNESDRIIAKTIEDYKNGEYPNQNLQSILISKLSKGGWDTTKLKTTLAEKQNLIASRISKIEDLVSKIKEVTSAFNNINATLNLTIGNRVNILKTANTAAQQFQAGYQRRLDLRAAIIETYKTNPTANVDKHSAKNAQVISLQNFVDNREMDNMPLADAIAVICGYEYVENGQTIEVPGLFTGCGISYDKSKGKLSVPKGHGDTAAHIYSRFIKSFKENYGEDATTFDVYDPTPPGGEPDPPNVKRTDPISFTKGDVTYDFVTDRDGDGTFDDATEFLGAKNGWAEMKALDTNKDGIIMGKELNNLNMLAINNQNGQYNFVNAKDVGITSINLNTYQEINQEQNNHDILAGTFKINLDDEIIEGKHTLDTQQNLDIKYSTAFGSEADDQTDMYKLNPFKNAFQQTIETPKIVAKNEIAIEQGTRTIDKIIDSSEKKILATAQEESELAKSEKKQEESKSSEPKEINSEEKDTTKKKLSQD